MTRTATEKCHHCSLVLDPRDRRQTEVSAVWVDAYGDTDGGVRVICRACLDAGAPAGPGYRRVGWGGVR